MSHDDPMFTASLNQSDERKGLVERLRDAAKNTEGLLYSRRKMLNEAADLLERDSIQLRECGEEVVQPKPQIESSRVAENSNAKSGIPITHQPEYDALNTFDAENNVEPTLTIARRIAQKYDMGRNLELIEDIHYALQDVQDVSERRGRVLLLVENGKPIAWLERFWAEPGRKDARLFFERTPRTQETTIELIPLYPPNPPSEGAK